MAESCDHDNLYAGTIKGRNFLIAERLLASEDSLYSVELKRQSFVIKVFLYF